MLIVNPQFAEAGQNSEELANVKASFANVNVKGTC